VTALGTAFDVRLDADQIQVTLIEGRVAVRGLGIAAHQPTLELKPNQQLIALDGELPTVQAVDSMRASAWAEGQVFFTDEALPAAVAEMNHYSAQQIVVCGSHVVAISREWHVPSRKPRRLRRRADLLLPDRCASGREGRIVLRSRPQGAPAH